jgi:hypothetical protein
MHRWSIEGVIEHFLYSFWVGHRQQNTVDYDGALLRSLSAMPEQLHQSSIILNDISLKVVDGIASVFRLRSSRTISAGMAEPLTKG